MEFQIKAFSDLTPTALYELLQLRTEVFVVEQNCVYQDLDGKDQKALHILGYENEQLVAYARCFAPGIYFKEAAIGRVLVRDSHRKYRYGHDLLRVSINAIEQRYGAEIIKLSAQSHLRKFYESHGFHKIGEGYLEDGIPHIAMTRKMDMY